MKIKPAIRTLEEIESLVSDIAGTWVRRKNAKSLMVEWSNDLIKKDIELQKIRIRKLKSEGAKQGDLRPHYAEVTKLELQLI